MCGRYTLTTPLGDLVEVFDVSHVAFEEWVPRFNIAPTQIAPVLIRGSEGDDRLGPMRWGLVPAWADDPTVGSRMINARAETARSKPAFRDAFRARRCLVPADGFYEWRKPPEGRAGKTPFLIRDVDRRPFAMAGLWERWRAPDGDPLHTFTILTVEAPPWLRPIHGRTPAIVPPGHWPGWLGSGDPGWVPGEPEAEVGGPRLEAVEVSSFVNRPGNDSPECAEPVPGGECLSPEAGG